MPLWRRRRRIITSLAIQQPTKHCFHNPNTLQGKLLTPELVLTTLHKTPCDLLSLKFFLWCARQPHYFHPRPAFDHITPVLARLLHNSGSSVKALIHKLQTFGGENTIKPQTLFILLRIFWHGGMYDCALQLFDQMPTYGFLPNTFSRNILIDVLFKIGRSDVALELLGATKDPNFLTFSIAVSNLCKLRDFVKLRGVLRTMLRNGFYLNSGTFSYVLDCFCKSGNMGESFQILGLMISLGIPVSVSNWTVLIHGFCQSGDVVMADYLFGKMVDSGCSPNVVTYTSLIKGLMDTQMPERALFILSTMESKGCVPDLVLCNVLIESLSRLGRYDDALDVYFSLPKWNLAPDSYTLCAIISAVCLSKQFDLLPLLISGICIQADLMASNCLLSYFCKAGYPSAAVEFYNDMIIRGFTPDRYSYAGLLTGLCGMGKLHKAVNMYNTILKKGFGYDPHIHTIIISGLVSSGKLQTAIRLFRNAVENKYPLDVVSYTAVIQGLVRGGRVEEAYDLFGQMKGEGVAPNAYTYSVIISSFCRANDIKMVRELLSEMIVEGIAVDYHVFSMVKNLLFRSRCSPSSFNILIEMCHSDMVLDKALGALLLKGLRYWDNLGCNLVSGQNVDSSGSDESDVAVAVG